MASAEDAVVPPAEPPVYKLVGDGRPWSSLDASMKQFYINEQQRMEMEHGLTWV